MCGHYSLTQFTKRRWFSSTLSKTSRYLKKKERKKKRIPVSQDEIKRNHTTLKKILGSLPGPPQQLSLGPGSIVAYYMQLLVPLFSIETTLFPEEPSFPTGSFHSSAQVACHWGGREGGGLKGQRGEMKGFLKGERRRKGSLLCRLETCLSSSCKSGIVRISSHTYYNFLKSHSELTFPKCHV